MEDVEFSDEFCRFLQTAITSVDAAEVLLLLHAHPEVAWGPRQIVEKLASIAEADAAKHLDALLARGVVAQGDDRRFQYRPGSAELDAYVQTLAQAYKERPVTLIRMIYALRDSKIRTFADAFKIRGK